MDPEETLLEAEAVMEKGVDYLSHEFAAVRTGKASGALVENIDVDAYGSVMFQNENLTVRAGDDFMRAAVDGRDWWTCRVTDGDPCEKKNARELLRKIALGTWTCGDPGMQFDTTIHTWHTCKGSGRQHSTNPCSEYLFLNDTACNLASLNLVRFQTSDGIFERSCDLGKPNRRP